ncbi:MAG: LON peptidase substrate-binding domain-containing protein [Deltaproteobacteria bacterium]|nr:LON peptidase substrate-binding domain-containing protein [Myxococcales bacterium]MDP3215240.1 LON peptidase substrate-binding domain-containing protein [Deltaproteobacteria bacterium]
MSPMDAVPVFPLPGVVLLPDQRMPLHIFEPRYRAMVRDSLATHGWIVVCPIVGDAEADPPAIAAVATAGRIVAHQQLPDGRFNILVEGMVRVRLEELPFVAPYRRAKATAMPEPDDVEVAPVERAAMLSTLASVLRVVRDTRPQFEFAVPTELPSSRLALRLVDRFVIDAATRQRVLEAERGIDRVTLATEALAELWTAGETLRAVGSA